MGFAASQQASLKILSSKNKATPYSSTQTFEPSMRETEPTYTEISWEMYFWASQSEKFTFLFRFNTFKQLFSIC